MVYMRATSKTLWWQGFPGDLAVLVGYAGATRNSPRHADFSGGCGLPQVSGVCCFPSCGKHLNLGPANGGRFCYVSDRFLIDRTENSGSSKPKQESAVKFGIIWGVFPTQKSFFPM